MEINTDNFMKVCLMKIPHRRLVGAAATCFLVTGLASLPPTALAGPDQNKHTVYGTHMDLSPEAAVNEDDNVTGLGVVVGFDSHGKDDEQIEFSGRPAEEAVMWVPAWGRFLFTSTEQTPFVAPNGSIVWQAPQDVGTDQLPIYFGYNSGAKLQEAAESDEIQDRNYSLDLLKVEGPGEAEVFTATSAGIVRVFSSKDKSLRSLIKPRHSHYHTTFTKPGRYVFTYQATAYDNDGKPIKTMPMELAWQVGGNKPDEGKIRDFKKSWENAKQENGSGKISFHPSQKNSGKNTDIRFEGSGDGRLILLIDGYFLDELPVKNGKAETTNYLGEGESQYQALFIPDDSDEPAWLSSAFGYKTGDTKDVSETADDIEEPDEIDEELVWHPESISLDNNEVEVKLTPQKDGKHLLSIIGDENLQGYVTVKLFDKKRDDISPSCSIEGRFDKDGKINQEFDVSACVKLNPWLKVNVTPHPLAAVKPIDSELIQLDLSKEVAQKFEFEETEEKESPEVSDTFGSYKRKVPSDDSAVTSESNKKTDSLNEQPKGQQTQSSSKNVSSTKEEAPSSNSAVHELTAGHIDIRLSDDDDGLGFSLEHKNVQHPLESTAIRVGDNTRQVREKKLSDPKWDFLGEIDESFYLLPSSEEPQKPWPGFSSEEVDYGDYPEGIDIILDDVKTPEGGRAVFYQADALTGQVEKILDSVDSKYRMLNSKKPLHLHGNWSFSKPGQYTLYFKAMSGDKEIAKPQPVTFLVGNDTVASSEQGVANKNEKEAKKAHKVPPVSDQKHLVNHNGKKSESSGGTDESKNTHQQNKTAKKEDPNVKKSAIKQKLAETGSYADLLLPAALAFFGIGFAVLGLVRMRRQ